MFYLFIYFFNLHLIVTIWKIFNFLKILKFILSLKILESSC